MATSKKLLALIWTVVGSGAGAVGTLAYYQNEVGDLQGRLNAATDDYKQQQKRADALAEQLRQPAPNPLVDKYKADALTCGVQLDAQKSLYDRCRGALNAYVEDHETLTEVRTLQARKQEIDSRIDEINNDAASGTLRGGQGPENLSDLRKDSGYIQDQIILLEGRMHPAQ